ncbi:hypothetical protein [Chloroflexus sp.]|uniref:hypothetical protein n=1 Tax=Chloroflexus sp. TaxID=1904827 RepID=UPI002ADE447A|nr:hypothetical protein [Chloroflexus sp.]
MPLRPLDRSASYQVLLKPRAYEQGRQQAYEQARQIEAWLADPQQRAAADAICDGLETCPWRWRWPVPIWPPNRGWRWPTITGGCRNRYWPTRR